MTDHVERYFNTLTESRSLVSSIKQNGIRSIEQDVYEYTMRIKNIEDENDALLLMRQINNRISILSKNNENKIIEVNSKSNILIEVRKDYKLKEKTVQITEDNIENILRDGIAIFDSETVFAKNQLLPEDLFLSQISEINIFINGACYGKDFSKAKDQDAIILTNLNLIKVIKVNDKITFEWR